MKMLTAESRDFASLLPPQAEALRHDDLFEEYPGGPYRGLAFVTLFNVLLIFLGALLFGTHIL